MGAAPGSRAVPAENAELSVGRAEGKGCSELGWSAGSAGNRLWGCVRAPARKNRPATEYVEGLGCGVECWHNHSVPFPGFSTKKCVKSRCRGTEPSLSFVLVQDLSILGLCCPSHPWKCCFPCSSLLPCVVSEIPLHVLPRVPERCSGARISPGRREQLRPGSEQRRLHRR